MSPAALTFLLHCSLRSLGTKVIGNDGTGMLHIQEVRRQRALGCVWIMGTLLALLLLLNSGCQLRHRHEKLTSGSLKAGQQVTGSTISGLSEKEVSLTEVVRRERTEKLQDSVKTTNSLIRTSVFVFSPQCKTWRREDDISEIESGRWCCGLIRRGNRMDLAPLELVGATPVAPIRKLSSTKLHCFVRRGVGRWK